MTELVSSWASFGGKLSVFDHQSAITNCTMRYAVYEAPQTRDGPVPVLWYLSGLTCNWSNVMEKGNIQRAAAEHGVMIIAPDTSPRGAEVPDDEGYDLGQGAGFYLSATEEPWLTHFQMDRYVTQELQDLIFDQFDNIDRSLQGIFGHSMGGHGALTLHLKNPELYKSVSAFAPIVAPTQVPWGQKAFKAYLGEDEVAWGEYDACQLVQARTSTAEMLLDFGLADQFLEEQLRPDLIEKAAEDAGQKIILRKHPGYDHSYYFIASFMDDHIKHHVNAMCR